MIAGGGSPTRALWAATLTAARVTLTTVAKAARRMLIESLRFIGEVVWGLIKAIVGRVGKAMWEAAEQGGPLAGLKVGLAALKGTVALVAALAAALGGASQSAYAGGGAATYAVPGCVRVARGAERAPSPLAQAPFAPVPSPLAPYRRCGTSRHIGMTARRAHRARGQAVARNSGPVQHAAKERSLRARRATS
jgi:hypothetical protein